MKKIILLISILSIVFSLTLTANAATINETKEIEIMTREIPETAVEIQEGLYLYSYTRTIAGTVYTFRHLYSADGYCFYDNTLPEEERIYMQYASLGMADSEANYTSVPIEDWMEIVSVGGDSHVTV